MCMMGKKMFKMSYWKMALVAEPSKDTGNGTREMRLVEKWVYVLRGHRCPFDKYMIWYSQECYWLKMYRFETISQRCLLKSWQWMWSPMEYAGRKSKGPKWTPVRHQSLKADQKTVSQRRRRRKCGKGKGYLQKHMENENTAMLQKWSDQRVSKWGSNWKFLVNETKILAFMIESMPLKPIKFSKPHNCNHIQKDPDIFLVGNINMRYHLKNWNNIEEIPSALIWI